jgi:hypothetical protein
MISEEKKARLWDWWGGLIRPERIAAVLDPRYKSATAVLLASSISQDIVHNYDGSWPNQTKRIPRDETL